MTASKIMWCRMLVISALVVGVLSSCPHHRSTRSATFHRQKRSWETANLQKRTMDRIPARRSFSPLPRQNSEQNITQLLLEAEQFALAQLTERVRQEEIIFQNGGAVPLPENVQMAGSADDIAWAGIRSLIMEQVSRFVANRTGDVAGLQRISLRGTPLEYICEPILNCTNIQYRSYNGSCTNLRNTNWGQSSGAVNRFLPYVYPDGISSPRGADRSLPSTRQISARVFSSTSNVLTGINHYWSTWGQLLTHESIVSVPFLGLGPAFFECCTPEVIANPALLHPECLPIPIPPDDPFYSQFGETCMMFMRSFSAPRSDCTLGPRTHMNVRTSVIDAGFVYGNEPDLALALRSFQGGRLLSNLLNGREVPPHDDGAFLVSQLPDSGCYGEENDPNSACPVAGDFVNAVQPQISTFTIMHLRQHNSLADELARLNPHWDDERIYQEARKIIYSHVQLITYNEYLPILLGENIMARYKLTLRREGYSYDYDSTVDPTLVDEFGVVGFRLGHVTMPDVFNLIEDDEIVNTFNLHEISNRPFNFSSLDQIAVGGLRTETLAVDNTASTELSNQLLVRRYSPGGVDFPFGLDLMAVNTMRARDHGIGPYNDYRQFCGLERAKKFSDLAKWMPEDAAKRIASIYKHVDDIDAYPGAMAETPLPGAVVGPLVTCLVGEQYRRFKVGDRFWFENANQPSSFTPAQLREIRRFSLARLFCDYTDNIREIQIEAFRIPSETNPIVSCDDPRIPKMNLSPWQESYPTETPEVQVDNTSRLASFLSHFGW